MTLLAVLVAAAVLAGLVAHGAGRVRRLHRLHVRVDAARHGLDAALHRRAEVAAGIARTGSRAFPVSARPRGPAKPGSAREPARDVGHPAAPGSAGLGVAAAAALGARGVDPAREVVENVLGRELAALDRGALPEELLAELVETELLVVVGRSVYHDAVRDTRDLRSRRMVRWLRLAGTAPLPAYLDIAVTPDSPRNAVAPTDVASVDRRSTT